MGVSPHSLIANSIQLKGMSLQSKGTNNCCKTKVLGNKIQGKRANKKFLMVKRRQITQMKSKRVFMKRKPRPAPCQQGKDLGFKTKVQTLKGLIPNHESKGLEGLFRDTADYILALQMRVRVMQMMVDALEDGYNTTSSHE